MTYVIGKPSIYNQSLMLERVKEILDSHWYSNNGSWVQQLEQHVEDMLAAPCVAVTNATVGLEMSLRLFPPGEVIVPSFTFIGTVNAISNAGHVPVFCDIDENYQMVFDSDLVTDNTVAIMPVDLFGSMVSETPKYANRHIPVIYDSAHAFGCGEGTFGDVQVFSFHPTKFCGGFAEGGIIVSEDTEVIQKLKTKRNFGYKYGNSNIHGELVDTGSNYKMTEVAAASILTQIEYKEQVRDIYLANHYYYSRYLPKWVDLKYPNHDCSNFSYIVCEVDKDIREDLLLYLHANGIMARKYFPPIHMFGPYKTDISLPNTERAYNCILQLPTGLMINKEDIESICGVIEAFGQIHRKNT